MRILLVDDDPATLDVLDFALAMEGHEVLRATDGAEGLQMARAQRPDLMIVDSMMPVMDGITMAKEIRQDPVLANAPVLMLTAKAMQNDVWAGWQAGVDSYITKPLDVDILRAEIDRVCGPALVR
jgi:DNA-binding response OmpR family regulator